MTANPKNTPRPIPAPLIVFFFPVAIAITNPIIPMRKLRINPIATDPSSTLAGLELDEL